MLENSQNFQIIKVKVQDHTLVIWFTISRSKQRTQKLGLCPYIDENVKITMDSHMEHSLDKLFTCTYFVFYLF